jgi:phosphatidylglycerol---prolipoprotein diacylglyceryl transferase
MPLFAFPFPAIDPIAIAVGPVAIRWYALAYVAGLLGGWFYARRLAARTELWTPLPQPSAADIDDLIVWVALDGVLGVIVGGRLGYVLFYNLDAYLARPAEILAVWHGGMSFHGGFLGAVLAIVGLARSRGLNPLALLDMAAVVTPIGLFFGRIANFINGELWGRAAPNWLPWAMIFPHAGMQPRHPSQLYQAVLEGLLLFVVMFVLSRRQSLRARFGTLTGVFLSGYAIARIIGEFFREPDAFLGFLAFGTTMGQILSIPMLLAGLWLIIRARPVRPG